MALGPYAGGVLWAHDKNEAIYHDVLNSWTSVEGRSPHGNFSFYGIRIFIVAFVHTAGTLPGAADAILAAVNQCFPVPNQQLVTQVIAARGPLVSYPEYLIQAHYHDACTELLTAINDVQILKICHEEITPQHAIKVIQPKKLRRPLSSLVVAILYIAVLVTNAHAAMSPWAITTDAVSDNVQWHCT